MPIRRIKGTLAGLPMNTPVAYTSKNNNTRDIRMIEMYREPVPDAEHAELLDVVDGTTFSGLTRRLSVSLIDGYIYIARKGGRHDFKAVLHCRQPSVFGCRRSNASVCQRKRGERSGFGHGISWVLGAYHTEETVAYSREVA